MPITQSRKQPHLVVASSTFGGPADYYCDGTADQVQIQAAIDALSTTGGTVELTAGTFNLANAGTISDGIVTPYCVKIVQTNGPIQLIGQGQKATKLFLTNSQAANSISVLIRGAVAGNRTAPTRIADLEIDGNDANQTGWDDFAALEVAYADNVTIEDCYLHNGEFFTCQIFRDSKNFRVVNNWLEAGPNTALRVESGPGIIEGNAFTTNSGAAISGLNITTNADIDVRAHDITVVGNTFDVAYNGLRISGGLAITVTGNAFRNATHASGIALLMEGYQGGGNDYTADSCIILGNTFYNCRNGIKLDIFAATTLAATKARIAENIITEGAITLDTGINEATTNNSGIIIEFNTITGATTAITTTASDTVARNNVGASSSKDFITSADVSSALVPEGRSKDASNTAYSLPGVDAISVGTKALTANRVQYFPILVASTITLDRLALEVTSAGAGSTTARMGIYNCDKDLQPTTRVVDGGTVAVDSTGIKTVTISQELVPGRYLLALNSDGAPTLRAVRGGSRYSGFVTALGTSAFVNTLFVAQTYAAFPTPGTVWTTGPGGGGGATPMDYCVFCRVSAP